MQARHVLEPNLVIAAAFAYGGLVQLLAGMWYVSSCHLSRNVTSLTKAGNWLLATHSEPLRCRPTEVSGSP